MEKPKLLRKTVIETELKNRQHSAGEMCSSVVSKSVSLSIYISPLPQGLLLRDLAFFLLVQ